MVGGGVGGIWGVTITFLYIVSFGCETPSIVAEGWKIENIPNGLLKV